MNNNSAEEIIERLRTRAKDNKVNNVEYFLSKAFTTIENLRNLLITISISGIGILYSGKADNLPSNIAIWLFISIVLGVMSFLLEYLSLISNSNHYSMRERIFSTAYPTFDEYKKMCADEQLINNNPAQFFNAGNLVLLVFQASCLLIALSKLL